MTPTPPLPIGASVDQIGIVVRDVQAMAEKLYHTLGIGPFRLME